MPGFPLRALRCNDIINVIRFTGLIVVMLWLIVLYETEAKNISHLQRSKIEIFVNILLKN